MPEWASTSDILVLIGVGVLLWEILLWAALVRRRDGGHEEIVTKALDDFARVLADAAERRRREQDALPEKLNP